MQVLADIQIIATDEALAQMFKAKSLTMQSSLFMPLALSDLSEIKHLFLMPPLQLQVSDIDKLVVLLQQCSLQTLIVSGLPLSVAMQQSFSRLLATNPGIQLVIEDCDLTSAAARHFRTAMTTIESSDTQEAWSNHTFFATNDQALQQLEIARSQNHQQAAVWCDRVRRALGGLAYSNNQLDKALHYFESSLYWDPEIRSDITLKYVHVQNILAQEAADAAAIQAAQGVRNAAMGA